MRNIIVTNVLDYEFGGRTKSLIQRANLLSENGQDVEILFTGLDSTLETKFDYMKENNIINNDVKLTSIWSKFRESDQLKKYNFEKRPEKKIYTPVLLHSNTEVSETGEVIEKGELKEIIYKFKNNSRETAFTDVLDDSGYLFRRKYYVFNNLVRSTFYNQGEKEFLEFHYYNNKTSVVTPDGRAITYNDYKSEFFKDYLGDEEGTNIIVDARKEDVNILKCDFELSKVFFILHSSHTDINGKIHTNYQRIIAQSKENYKIVTLTEEQKFDIITHDKYNGCQVFVIGHPQEPVNNKLEIDQDRYVIISRLEKSKQILDAVKAFGFFAKEHPNKKLEIFGHGTQENIIQNYIDKNELNDNIRLNGYTTDPLSEYEQSYAGIITTQFEGFGMSMAESLSVGCPVISYKFKYGQKDMIVEGLNGFITEDNTVASLYKLLCETHDLKQKRKKVRRTISKYKIENISKLWLAALTGEEIVEKKSILSNFTNIK